MTAYDLWQLGKYGNILPSSEPGEELPDTYMETQSELQLINDENNYPL